MKYWKKSSDHEAVCWTGENPLEIVRLLLSIPEVVPMQLVLTNSPIDFGYRGRARVLSVGDWLVWDGDDLVTYCDALFHETFMLPPPAPPVNEFPKRPSFMDDLTTVLNRHCAEISSNTPDFILAEFLNNCLAALNRAAHAREDWYNVYCMPGKPPCDSDHRPVTVRNVP